MGPAAGARSRQRLLGEFVDAVPLVSHHFVELDPVHHAVLFDDAGDAVAHLDEAARQTADLVGGTLFAEYFCDTFAGFCFATAAFDLLRRLFQSNS